MGMLRQLFAGKIQHFGADALPPGRFRHKQMADLAGFMAGFKLAWGIAKELEADGLYSFDYEEEQRAFKAAEQEVKPRGKETG